MHPGGQYPAPDGKYYHIKQTVEDHEITGYTTKEYGEKKELYIDALKFDFIPIGGRDGGQCAVQGFSESYNETYYDYDANFCNLYNTFNGTGLNFSEPALVDCLYRPKDLRQCNFASEEKTPKLPFMQ